MDKKHQVIDLIECLVQTKKAFIMDYFDKSYTFFPVSLCK